METTRLARRFVITSLLTLLVPIVLFAPQAYAESYVAGQFGVTFPQSLSNGNSTSPGRIMAGLDISVTNRLKSSRDGGGNSATISQELAGWASRPVCLTPPLISKQGFASLFTGPLGGSAKLSLGMFSRGQFRPASLFTWDTQM